MKVDYLIINGEKKFKLLSKAQVPGIRKKTNNVEIVKINLFLSSKERTKHNTVIFSKVLPNNQIITASRIELWVQEMTMNEKFGLRFPLTSIGEYWKVLFCHRQNLRAVFLFYFQHFCHSGNAVLTKLRLHISCNKNNIKKGFY